MRKIFPRLKKVSLSTEQIDKEQSTLRLIGTTGANIGRLAEPNND